MAKRRSTTGTCSRIEQPVRPSMKCALIIPDWTPEQIFPAGTAGSQLNYWQPLGILYVAAALIKAGHEVRFIDGAFLTRDEILDQVTDWKPAFAGS